MSNHESKTNKKLDRVAYICLYVGFVIGAAGIYLSRFDSMRQFTVILLLVSFYLIWGLIYHNLRRDASRKLLIEYLTIAVIALLSTYLVLIV